MAAFVVQFKVIEQGATLDESVSPNVARSHIALKAVDQAANKDSGIELYALGSAIGAAVVPGQLVNVTFTPI